jgi:hypothetical protein
MAKPVQQTVRDAIAEPIEARRKDKAFLRGSVHASGDPA